MHLILLDIAIFVMKTKLKIKLIIFWLSNQSFSFSSTISVLNQCKRKHLFGRRVSGLEDRSCLEAAREAGFFFLILQKDENAYISVVTIY